MKSNAKKRINEIKHAASVAGKSTLATVKDNRTNSLAGVIRNEKDAGVFMGDLRNAISIAQKK